MVVMPFMPFMRMCYVRTCLVDGPVLQSDIFCGKSYIMGDISNDRFLSQRRTGFTV